MHEIDFDHTHLSPEQRATLQQAIWSADNVELVTVGIDIGSSTTHLMFARIHLRRLATALSSRFVVVDRRILHSSPILLTPYRADRLIDVHALAHFIADSYAEAGITQQGVDTGAVILTGEALKRGNAEAIAHLFAGEAGKFVCAAAGHHLECAMAAHGSGAVALSREGHRTVLNIDIGGGTTKLGLAHDGEVLHRAAMEIGGRLVAFDRDGRINRIEQPAFRHAAVAGVRLEMGRVLSPAERGLLAETMVGALIPAIRQQRLTGLAAQTLVTEPLPAEPLPDLITFSGGVSEYIYRRDTTEHDDLGKLLAGAVVRAINDGRIPYEVVETGQGIRATVIGAAQFSAQVSGNTVAVSNHASLPLRNVPVLYPALDLARDPGAERIAHEIVAAHARADMTEGEGTVALAFRWHGDPRHDRLKALADGIARGLARTVAAGRPVVLMLDGDIGQSIGGMLHNECGLTGDVIGIDGVQLKEFDYVDIGAMIRPTNVVPLVVKSLLFR